ncbi:MAG: glycerol-3-phosphate 1-O-acyltransferase PlsY [Oscillospiraceae bacterium]
MQASDIFKLFLGAAWGYLLGSVNFAVIISRIKGRDVRKLGSGNAGSTNMLRNFGVKYAALTFIGDFLKGSTAVYLVGFLLNGDDIAIIARGVAAIFVVIGHMKPLYFGFKGGKGVATALGALAILNPVPFAFVITAGVSMVFITGYVSLAAVTLAVLYPVAVYVYSVYTNTLDGRVMLIAGILASMVIISHRANIKRLLTKTENSIYKKKGAQ